MVSVPNDDSEELTEAFGDSKKVKKWAKANSNQKYHVVFFIRDGINTRPATPIQDTTDYDSAVKIAINGSKNDHVAYAKVYPDKLNTWKFPAASNIGNLGQDNGADYFVLIQKGKEIKNHVNNIVSGTAALTGQKSSAEKAADSVKTTLTDWCSKLNKFLLENQIGQFPEEQYTSIIDKFIVKWGNNFADENDIKKCIALFKKELLTKPELQKVEMVEMDGKDTFKIKAAAAEVKSEAEQATDTLLEWCAKLNQFLMANDLGEYLPEEYKPFVTSLIDKYQVKVATDKDKIVQAAKNKILQKFPQITIDKAGNFKIKTDDDTDEADDTGEDAKADDKTMTMAEFNAKMQAAGYNRINRSTAAMLRKAGIIKD